MDKNQPQPTDTLYQSYDRFFYKITGSETQDSIMQAMSAESKADNSIMVNVPADLTASGQGTAITNMTNGGIMAGKQKWSDTIAGLFIGIDTDGTAKINIGNASKYIRWDGTNLSVVGGLSVSSLDIPDAVTTNSFHVDTSGNAWWGATVIGSAVAKILNTGAASFSNITVTGGSIAGGVITSGSITTSQLNFTPVQSTNVVASINASSEGITITGSRLTINSSTTFTSGYDPTTKLANSAGTVSATNLGTTVISGGKIITSLLTASNITTGTLDASVVSVTNLNASNITSGTITVGGASAPGTIKILTTSESYSSAKIYWVNSSGTNKGRIWTDDNGYLGMNALGGQIYFYTNSNQALFVSDSAQSVFGTGGLKVQGAFNIGDVGGSTVNARINGGYFYLGNTGTGEYLLGQAGTASWLNSTTYTYLSVGGTAALRASSTGVTVYGTSALYIANANKIDFQNYTLTMNANKTAIVPTSQGYNALYCTESPEVWFMDFCNDNKELDPLFEEVSTGPYHFIKCESGGYQVWGKRKGHEQFRFENKTEEEFLANERFLNMNKPENSLRASKVKLNGILVDDGIPPSIKNIVKENI